MTPAERVMPVIEVRFDELRRRWVVLLPMGAIEAPDTEAAEELVRRHAPGSAIRLVRDAFRGEPVEPSSPRTRTGLSPEGATALNPTHPAT